MPYNKNSLRDSVKSGIILKKMNHYFHKTQKKDVQMIEDSMKRW